MFKKIQHIHFVGIGGSGMSGIAEVLLHLGYKVSGSDLKKTEVTDYLESLGARFFIGHEAKNILGANVVVTSTAVHKTNPEVVEAEKNKIPVIPRIEMLAELARLKYTVSIAGTHGKTTTTSMACLVLEQGGLDPTMVIGGRLKNIKSGAKLGKGDYLVAEADESDGSFLKLSPTLVVVTNIDNDHLDYYGTLENIKRAFVEHINSIPFYGKAILCADDPNVAEILPKIRRPYCTYGFNAGADFTAKNIAKKDSVTEFEVYDKSEALLGRISLKVPGNHNVLNALAAVAVGVELEIPFKKIAEALSEYAGVGRRIEIKGEKNGVLVIDDYGHHPTEIKATISAVKGNWPSRKLTVLFQPHRYSRTAHLYKDFGKAFELADAIKILDIYAAGEEPIPGVTSKLIIDAIKANGKNPEPFNGIEMLAKELKPGGIVLTLGAGDVWKKGEELLKLIH